MTAITVLSYQLTGKYPLSGYINIGENISLVKWTAAGNQKVVTAGKSSVVNSPQFCGKQNPICQNPFVKALSAPYWSYTALHDENKTIVYAVTIQNRGLWSVCIRYSENRKSTK